MSIFDAEVAVEHLTVAQRAARGRAARAELRRRAHGAWEPPPHRRRPVSILQEQAASRVPELVPVRNGRMLASPFTFYRGAAAIMSADLATQPHTGLTTDSAAIAGYLGSSDAFDRALADFGEAYADQNNRDYQEMLAAVDDGTLEAHTGV